MRSDIHRCDTRFFALLSGLLARYALQLERIPDGAIIPGSFWGGSEAGIIAAVVYVQADTPLHSALHEACHVICMDAERRMHLHTDAGGEYAEEDAVCYLQIVLAAELGLTAEQICADMDAWGYTFRLGSALAWFTQDAADAREWLVRHGLLTVAGEPTFRLRVA